MKGLGPQRLEAVFLRKELQVGKFEMELPFWAGEIAVAENKADEEDANEVQNRQATEERAAAVAAPVRRQKRLTFSHFAVMCQRQLLHSMGTAQISVPCQT